MQPSTPVRITHLITTRNRCEYLTRTLANVREFITPDDELIVIDGGSSDRTVEILEANRDLVTFFLSEPDKGEAHAFNKGWRRARGKDIPCPPTRALLARCSCRTFTDERRSTQVVLHFMFTEQQYTLAACVD